VVLESILSSNKDTWIYVLSPENTQQIFWNYIFPWFKKIRITKRIIIKKSAKFTLLKEMNKKPGGINYSLIRTQLDNLCPPLIEKMARTD